MTGTEQESARIGLLVPSSNTVMEVDFYRHLPPGMTLHTARMYMERTTPEGEAMMLDRHTLPAARDVGTARPDVLVFGCTSAGALRGNDYERRLCKAIAQEAGTRVISVMASVRDAIRRRRATRIGVVTPYVEALNERIRSSLKADGFAVPIIAGLGLTDNFDIGLVSPTAIVDFAVESLSESAIDLVFVSCTNFRALEARPLIEERLHLPVVTSNSAALEATLEAVAEGRGGSTQTAATG